MGFKLDFHKAYNCLECDFILAALKALGFNQKSLQLIHQCILTVRYTLLLNGTISTSFSPFRGIRKGDPLSSYLFILCNEVLARLINREKCVGTIFGVRLGLGAPLLLNCSMLMMFYYFVLRRFLKCRCLWGVLRSFVIGLAYQLVRINLVFLLPRVCTPNSLIKSKQFRESSNSLGLLNIWVCLYFSRPTNLEISLLSRKSLKLECRGGRARLFHGLVVRLSSNQ